MRIHRVSVMISYHFTREFFFVALHTAIIDVSPADYDRLRLVNCNCSSYTTGLNSVLLHRGHLPAASNGTGFVKCFIYRHSLHFHRIECSSCDRPIWLNAFTATSRTASRASFNVLSAESISSAPSAEVCQRTCAIFAPRDAANMLSCSYEHIRRMDTCLGEKSPRRFLIANSSSFPETALLSRLHAARRVSADQRV
jgi:hypothetical protein